MTTGKISKADILGGRFAKTREVPVEEWDGATITLTALTDGEWAEVEALRVRGVKLSVDDVDMSGEISDTAKKARKEQLRGKMMERASTKASMSMDVEALTFADAQADALALAYSLSASGEKWTMEDALAIRPPSVVARLAKIVYEISDVTVEDIAQIADFRGDAGRA